MSTSLFHYRFSFCVLKESAAILWIGFWIKREFFIVICTEYVNTEKMTPINFCGNPFRSQQLPILFICSFKRIYWWHFLSSISHLSSFFNRFFFPFHFHNKIIDILYNLIILKNLYLFTKKRIWRPNQAQNMVWNYVL